RARAEGAETREWPFPRFPLPPHLRQGPRSRSSASPQSAPNHRRGLALARHGSSIVVRSHPDWIASSARRRIDTHEDSENGKSSQEELQERWNRDQRSCCQQLKPGLKSRGFCHRFESEFASRVFVNLLAKRSRVSAAVVFGSAGSYAGARHLPFAKILNPTREADAIQVTSILTPDKGTSYGYARTL